MDKIRYSVVMPSYNSEKSIEKALDSVFSQDFEHAFEVLVVDSSEDKTPDIIKEKYPQVKLIIKQERTDQGKARNIGVRRAHGEFIFFIDSDCVAKPGWMKNLVRGFELGFHVSGGPVLNANPDSAVAWAGYFFEFNDLLPYGTSGEVEHVGSCNACYKREVLLKYGGFPSGLKFAVEDIMYNWFLSRRSVKMYNSAGAVVSHFHRESFLSYIKHQYKLARGTVQFLKNSHASGYWLTEHTTLALFVVPILPFIKFVRINAHIFRFNSSLYSKKPVIVPLIVLGLAAWLCGFTQELYFGEDVDVFEGVEVL